MGRNAYLRREAVCACGWRGIRKDAARPCGACGGPIQVLGPVGGRCFDQEIAPVKPSAKTFNNNAALGGGLSAQMAASARANASAMPDDEAQATGTGTSIFDPVLCELAYRWFSPKGGAILDPFAGGSVRGIVASKLERHYTGCELRPEQVAANRMQAGRICEAEFLPRWVQGDSVQTIPGLELEADFIFSCPPYGDLEVYSDLESDLSTMGHEAFLKAYRAIIAAAVAKLKADRFAAFVVGDYRCPKGFYRNFTGETVAAFEAAGARFYNDAVLVTSAGSLPIRAGKQFTATRKLGKTHQNLLVFCKGDPKRATLACGEVEFGELEAEEAGDASPENLEASPWA